MRRNARTTGDSAIGRFDPGSRRTFAGVAMFVLLSVSAVGITAVIADRAATQNQSAVVYESAVARLETILRGLNELALTEGTLGSQATVRVGMNKFRALRSGNEELAAYIDADWVHIEPKIELLTAFAPHVAFDEAAMIVLGSVTGRVGKLVAGLEQRAQVKRSIATVAESRVQIVNLAAGALMILTTAIFFVMREITARKALEIVSAGKTQLRAITDAVPALIAYVDAGQRFRLHNRAYEDVFGLTSANVQGKTLLEVFGAEQYETMRPRVAEVLSGTPVRYERSQLNRAGELRHYAEQYFPRYPQDAQSKAVIGFYSLMTDITELKRIDRMKSEFISTVSHELRTPLTSIRGSLGLIAAGMAGALPEAAKNLVDIAKNNCERLVRLINDILDIEKIESGEMHFELKVLEIAPLLEQSIAANQGFAAQHDVSLRLLTGGEGVRVRVDSDSLTQVVTNLLSNAVKFSPAGGSVDVGFRRADGRIRVEVRDWGPGIPEEFRSRIFKKFSQADSSDSRQKGGTGLGLNISKAIVERLGGTIGFDTDTGVGTTFFFELPEWQDAPPKFFTPGARLAKRACVLVCEDDHDIAQLIAMMLDKAGFDTDLAYTAAQARHLARSSLYAAMTVDLKLPDQDGISLIHELRRDERTRSLPIVVVSAISGEGRIRLNSETLSVSDWLGKPIDANRLVAAVRDAAHGAEHDVRRILHVEDDTDIQHVTAAIAGHLATFDFATALQEARARLLVGKYDLVLLDLNLAEGEGAGWKLMADIEALDPPPPVVIFSGAEVSRADHPRVAAVLVKARTSDQELLETLERILDRGRRSPAGSQGANLAQAA